MIWVKTYVFSTFDKKRGFSRLNLFPEQFFFITGSCWPPDSNFTMRKCTSGQYFQILNKKNIVGIFGSKVISAFYVVHFTIYNLLFSSNSDHNFQKQPKTAEHLILYTLCDMKKALQAFLTKKYDYNAFSPNLPIFNIYLLCIKQN